MRTYRFGLPNSDRVIVIVAENFTKAKNLYRAQLEAEGLL
ncbi:hypothetical protein UFOVP328_100 [uncultured Caudovirales phage]|uniref:Uncharacterized protein n=1 Tax=uncultured Caudovirales phage TaxID=2100421 RepID=A0A6J5LTS4_9CAUD|nr:hypothetical protein UFOVP328_100 [uncultured Caudovirales phage]